MADMKHLLCLQNEPAHPAAARQHHLTVGHKRLSSGATPAALVPGIMQLQICWTGLSARLAVPGWLCFSSSAKLQPEPSASAEREEPHTLVKPKLHKAMPAGQGSIPVHAVATTAMPGSGVASPTEVK